MGKTYMFQKEELIKLLHNAKIYVVTKAREFEAKGGDMRYITVKQSMQWYSDFITEEVDKKAIRMEDLLDEADEIFKHTHGKTIMEVAREKKSKIN